MDFKCILDPGSCIATGFHNSIASVPWWVWIVIAIIALGVAYRFGGWLGVVGLVGAGGYLLGRSGWAPYQSEHVDGNDAAPPFSRKPPLAKPKKAPKTRTLEDLFKDGLK